MKYKKKPIVIEAVKWAGNNFDEICNFIQEFHGNKIAYEAAESRAIRTGQFLIRTLEGVVTASNGDWIIRGVKGEFYPCKPDIFEATYEQVID